MQSLTFDGLSILNFAGLVYLWYRQRPNTIANGNNSAQIWNWALTSNGVTAFTFGETTADC